VSEFGKIANSKPLRAKETKTGTLQALARGNTGIIESTAEGQNMFKYMWDEAVVAKASGQMSAKDFYPVFLSWLDDPDCLEPIDQDVDDAAATYFAELEAETGRELTPQQKNFWIVQRRELGPELFQEYPATPAEAFQGARDGTYYNQIYLKHIAGKQRVVPKLYDDNLETVVFFDLGVDDYFVVSFAQYYNYELRLVDEYHLNGKNLEHYIREAESRGYNITKYVFPHDINVRELGTRSSSGRAVTRKQVVEDVFKEMGIRRQILIAPKSSIADGIETTKAMLQHTWIDPQCGYIVSCIQNYTKEWNERTQQFGTTPLHNEYSHGADVLRIMSQSLPALGWKLHKPKLTEQTYEDYEERPSRSGFAV
jgi:hypothetical protein